MKGFLDSLDIANRACQQMGCARILTIDEDSKQNSEISFCYDKLRRAELRRNTWKFAKRTVCLRAIDTTTRLLLPNDWDTDVTYRQGALVKDDNGDIWISTATGNVGNEPLTTSVWEAYFGPMTVAPYDEDTSYNAGELVFMESGSAGSYVVYMSLVGNNSDDPETATDYDAAETYRVDDVVRSGGSNWRSLIEVNTGITPAEGPSPWDEAATYSISETVTASDGYKYTATGTTAGDDPVTDGGVNWTNSGVATAWTAIPEQLTASNQWLPLYAALETMRILYPLGSGPASETSTRNIYRLPAGFVRVANQSPLVSLPHDPYEYAGEYVIVQDAGPVFFSFVADVTDVKTMDDMFCEGLAARIGFECAEAVTQSGTKKSTIASSYTTFMKEARLTNAIEMGPEEAEEDDFVSCRV